MDLFSSINFQNQKLKTSLEYKISDKKISFFTEFLLQKLIMFFVILIFVYVYLMNRLDKKFDVDEI